jgi:hypothetical protein
MGELKIIKTRQFVYETTGIYGSREMMFLRSRARPVRRADNLTVICEPTF